MKPSAFVSWQHFSGPPIFGEAGYFVLAAKAEPKNIFTDNQQKQTKIRIL